MRKGPGKDGQNVLVLKVTIARGPSEVAHKDSKLAYH